VRQCRATKASGEPCKGIATGTHGYCWAHAPENAEQRRRQASKAARSKGPSRELQDVKTLCKDLAEKVLSGEIQPGPAAVANQLINTRLRALEQERKVKETEDLEERLTRLEDALKHKKEGSRTPSWGA
jgi:hypothetical protein